MDAYENPFWDLTVLAAWAVIRERDAVRAAADPDNEGALFDIRAAHLARWREVNERLWAESGLSKPDDWRIEILADGIDPADLPPPFDELRAMRMRQLEAAGKIRLIRQDATFPIEDYLASLFRAGRINAIVYPPGDAAAHTIPSADWAFLEIAGGDQRRPFVRRIGERGPAFSDVHVARKQVLAVFPPFQGANAPNRPKPTTRGPPEKTKRRPGKRRTTRTPAKMEATMEAIKRFFPDGPGGKSNKEIADELKYKLGLKTLSVSTLGRAKKKMRRSRSSKLAKSRLT
jgi:hypothetical protein